MQVEYVGPGVGDPHCGGRSATQVVLADAVYYFKPGRTSKRAFMQACLQATGMDECMYLPPEIPLLDGYLQESIDCAGMMVSDVDFWHRAGQFAAIADCLSVTDIHYENVSSVRGAVALIDDETILTASPAPRVRGILATLLLQDPSNAAHGVIAGFMASRSTGRSRNFPTIQESRPGAELTVRFTAYGQRQQTSISREYGSISDSLDTFLSGLRSGYRKIRACRSLLEEVIISHAPELRSRVIIDATASYRRLSAMVSTAPLDSSARDLEDTLVDELVGVRRPFVPAGFIRSEANQLARGDVPFFVIDTTSHTVFDQWGPVGKVVRSPAARSAVSIAGVDEDYIEQQCSVVSEHVHSLESNEQE